MSPASADLLRRIETLALSVRTLAAAAPDEQSAKNLSAALKGMGALATMLAAGAEVFGIEPWHALDDDVPLDSPGEMLLRLKDPGGAAIAPYPLVMAFYGHGLTAALDSVLFLAALEQFAQGGERQVSINISARSLADPDFVRAALTRLETLSLAPGRRVILEIHESTSAPAINKKVSALLRAAGVMFALDDVGLHMNDVMRFAAFDGIADFIKLDRKSVNSSPQRENSLDHVVSLVHSMLPGAVMVAEGVKNAGHAADLRRHHPDIKYAQGLYLPPRDQFAREWQAATI